MSTVGRSSGAPVSPRPDGSCGHPMAIDSSRSAPRSPHALGADGRRISSVHSRASARFRSRPAASARSQPPARDGRSETVVLNRDPPRLRPESFSARATTTVLPGPPTAGGCSSVGDRPTSGSSNASRVGRSRGPYSDIASQFSAGAEAPSFARIAPDGWCCAEVGAAALLVLVAALAGAAHAEKDRAASIDWRRSLSLGVPEAGRLVRGVRLPATGRALTWDPVKRRQPNRGGGGGATTVSSASSSKSSTSSRPHIPEGSGGSALET